MFNYRIRFLFVSSDRYLDDFSFYLSRFNVFTCLGFWYRGLLTNFRTFYFNKKYRMVRGLAGIHIPKALFIMLTDNKGLFCLEEARRLNLFRFVVTDSISTVLHYPFVEHAFVSGLTSLHSRCFYLFIFANLLKRCSLYFRIRFLKFIEMCLERYVMFSDKEGDKKNNRVD